MLLCVYVGRLDTLKDKSKLICEFPQNRLSLSGPGWKKGGHQQIQLFLRGGCGYQNSAAVHPPQVCPNAPESSSLSKWVYWTLWFFSMLMDNENLATEKLGIGILPSGCLREVLPLGLTPK